MDSLKLTDEQIRKRQKSRNVAIAVCLVICIVLFYAITIFKMGGSVLNRQL
jgi:uncharacterized membrane protein affecting hemolysin expression